LREHLDQLNSILLDLHNIDIKIDDALIMFVSLQLSYENFKKFFISGKDSLSQEEVRYAFHNRQLCHSYRVIVSDDQTVGLVANNNKGYGKSVKRKFSKKPVIRGPKPTNICNYCKEKGHWKNDCPKKRQMQQQKASGIVVVVGTHSEEDITLVVDGYTHYSNVWVLNSRASYHIYPRREWFLTYEQLDGVNIAMANSSVCKVVGMGSIKIRTHVGKFCTLNEVRLVPHTTKNLISPSLLDKKGFSFKGEGGVIHVCKSSSVILKGVKQGTMYFLQGTTLTDSVVVASSEIYLEDMTRLWHMRLGH
jgi:hypothetical protein